MIKKRNGACGSVFGCAWNPSVADSPPRSKERDMICRQAFLPTILVLAGTICAQAAQPISYDLVVSLQPLSLQQAQQAPL